MICSTTTPPACWQLVRPWRGAHVDHLPDAPLPLREAQRPVVERRRQAEAVLDEHFLARAVAVVHPAHLRHGLVALIDDEHRVWRQVVEQRRRRLARPRGPRDAASSSRCRGSSRSRASSRGRTWCAGGGAAPRAARPAAFEFRQPLGQLLLDRLDRRLRACPRHHEVRLRDTPRCGRAAAPPCPVNGSNDSKLVDLVAEEPDAQPDVVVRRDRPRRCRRGRGTCRG